MEVFQTSIEAINPWSKETVYLKAEDIINPVDCYPWDADLSERVNSLCGGDCKSDFDWMTVYADLSTPEQMGIILLGS